MGGTKLESAQLEKDLGLIVDQSLSGSSQWSVAVKKKGQEYARMRSQEYRV